MKAHFITIKFEPKWILDNQSSGKTYAVSNALNLVGETYSSDFIFVLKKEFHMCSFILASESDVSADELISVFLEKQKKLSESVLSVTVETLDKSGLENVLIKCINIDQKTRDFFTREFKISFEPKVNDISGDEIIEIDNLLGLDNLKKWVKEVEKISDTYGEIASKTNIFKNISYLISINRGNGLSTILNIMADTLKKSGFAQFEGKCNFVEWKLTYSENQNDYSSFEDMLNLLKNVAVNNGTFKGILALDIEDWLDNLSDKRFDFLLDFVWENRDDIIFVFTVPYVEKSVLEMVYNRIDDIITTKLLKFIPPSDEQYFNYFCNLLGKYNIVADDSSKSSFLKKITKEKNDGRFYGFNTVKKITNEILYSIITDAVKEDKEIVSSVSDKTFDNLYDLDDVDGLTGLEQLNSMIALNDVKEKVKEIISTVKLQEELYQKGNSQLKPCFHMMFTGNPGTGKTVVARILGKIFKEEGLLSCGNFFEVSRKDFIGKFVGHTAPKTMEICRNAYGSVLFIDEAYMLADDRDGFSAEAIGTLIAEMENNRDKMIVIFAGYEKELENLFNLNPGLRDRIPYKINFPNYNRNELKEIFYIQLKDKVETDVTFESKTDEFFENLSDDFMSQKDFSNGRFVRNLAERIISKAALRFEMSGDSINEFKLTGSDFDVAISDSDFQKLLAKVKHVNKIGF